MQIQAFLREFHAKMLRRHLERLEQPLEDADRYTSNDALSPIKEEEEEEEQVAEEDGIYSYLVLVYLQILKFY